MEESQAFLWARPKFKQKYKQCVAWSLEVSWTAEDRPWSEHLHKYFVKYFVCSLGNQFAILKFSKSCSEGC